MPYAMTILALVTVPYRVPAFRKGSWEPPRPPSQAAGTRLTFQQRERQPWTAGLSAPPYLTARCRSDRVEQRFRVVSHRELGAVRQALLGAEPACATYRASVIEAMAGVELGRT